MAIHCRAVKNSLRGTDTFPERCAADKFESLIVQQLFVFLFFSANVEKFWVRALLF
jgi:hypothetical protein